MLKGFWYFFVLSTKTETSDCFLLCKKMPEQILSPGILQFWWLFYEQMRETEQNVLFVTQIDSGKSHYKMMLNHWMMHRGSAVAMGGLYNGFTHIMNTVMALGFIRESVLQMHLVASLCNTLGEYRVAPSEVRWRTCGWVWSCVTVKIEFASHFIDHVQRIKITLCFILVRWFLD